MTRDRRRAIAAGLIALGAALRLWQYLGRGSFWLDEAAIARNVAHRSWRGLLHPLDYAQIAPRGFLVFEKLATGLLGSGDHAFRLYSLLTALGALPLFYALARRVLDDRAALLALAWFAVLGRPIYYAAEAKQYGGDIFFASLLLLLALRVGEDDAQQRHWLRLGVIGAVAVWFSQPALFILGGIGVALFVGVARREIPLRWPSVVACSMWLASGVPAAWITLYSLEPPQQAYMRSFWSGGFWHLPPRSPADLGWPFVNFYGLFRDVLGMPLAILGVALFLLGGVAIWRRRPLTLVALLAPLGILYVAAPLRLFPFDATVGGFNKLAAANGRILLFLLPSLVLVVVAGLATMLELAARRVRIAGWACAALVLGPPAFYALTGIPYSPNDLAPALRVMREQARPEDRLYVYYAGRQPFEWYRDRVPFADARIVRGECHRPAWREYLRELDQFRGGGRLWVLVAHPARVMRVNEMDVVEGYLDRIAPRLGRWGGKDGYVLLYDMAQSRRPAGPAAQWHPAPRVIAGVDTVPLGASCAGVFAGPGVPGTVVP